MKNIELLAIIKGKGVTKFYHANTVETSCTCLRSAALLSRGAVQARGLSQTEQVSDAKDKKFGVWNDIFLDGVDIHFRSRRRNLYGPVLFELNAESVLKDRATQERLWITRENPINWRDGQSQADRYLLSAKAVEEDYQYGDFKSFTLKLNSGALSLEPHLERIVVDDPACTSSGKSVFDSAVEKLRSASRAGGLATTVVKHECQDKCRCQSMYQGFGVPLGTLFGT